MFKVLGLTVLLSFSGGVLATSIADSHTEMAGCESCHKDGVQSDDMSYENDTCISCHGPLAEFEGEVHQQHDDVLVCSDCHIVHETSSANDSCTSCH